MKKRDMFDDIIDILENRRHQGVRTVHLAAETRAAFFAPTGTSSEVAAASPRPRTGPAASDGGKPPARRPGAGRERSATAPADVHAAATQNLDWPNLKEQVAACDRCLLARGRTRTVFGEGNEHADLMFIGEGPGADEDQSGRPFVGPAGQLLTRMIQAMQLRREEVYIANIVKCRPPGNRNPRDQEAEACMHYLKRQIGLVAPRVIVLLGSVPLWQLLKKTGISQLHGTWLEYEGIPTLPTFHPSFLLRSPQRKKDAWEDLQKVMQRLGKDPRKTLEEMKRQQQDSRTQ